MKIRTGFVSNSSTSSFMIRSSAYPSVFVLAKEMLHIRNEDWDGPGGMTKTRLMKEIKAINASKLDPNTPIAFSTTNYDTYIVKSDDYYVVSTCHNHPFTSTLDGVVDGFPFVPELYKLIEYDQKDIKEVNLNDFREEIECCLCLHADFWLPSVDRVIRKIAFNVARKCTKVHGTDNYMLEEDYVILVEPDGTRREVCPKCEFGVSL